jgi:hypothetical protein
VDQVPVANCCQSDFPAVTLGTYSISFDLTPGMNSFFADQMNPVTAAIPFNSTPSGMTDGGAAVPEPASTAFLFVGRGGFALRRRSLRRQPIV